MRRAVRVLALLVVGALLALLGACGETQPAQERASADARARTLRLGARVFDEHCRTCHPLLGRTNTHTHTDYWPALDLDQVAPSPANVRERLRSGGVGMGSFEGTLGEAELRAVAAYVLDVGGREADVPPAPGAVAVGRGRALFGTHCQRCHQLAGRPPTNPNPAWAGTDFDQVRPGVLWTERIVREGLRIAMPSFRDRLTLSETRAVALYVNAAARGGPAARP